MSENISNFELMRRAMEEAESTLRHADYKAGTMARLLQGRLRQVGNRETLVRLKRELQDFNAHTKSWK